MKLIVIQEEQDKHQHPVLNVFDGVLKINTTEAASLLDAVNNEREVAEDAIDELEGCDVADQENYIINLSKIEDFLRGE